MNKLTLVSLLAILSSCRGEDGQQAQPSPRLSDNVGITLNARGELPALEVAIAPTPVVQAPLFLQELTSKIATLQSECFAQLEPSEVLDWTLYLRGGAVTHSSGKAMTSCLNNIFKGAQISSATESPEQYELHIQLRIAEVAKAR